MGRGKIIDTGLAFSYKVLDDDMMKLKMKMMLEIVFDGEMEEGDIDDGLAFSGMVPQDKDNGNDNQDYLCDGEEEKGDFDAGLALYDKLPSSQQKLRCDPIYQKPVMTIHIWCL